MFLCYLSIIISINVACVMCVNSALGYLPEYVPFLSVPLLVIIAAFIPAFLKDGQERKKEIKKRGIGLLSAFIIFALIGTLGYVCIKGYPLWSITLVLLITILYLIFGILFDPVKADRKDGKRLLLWGGLCGILFVGIILTVIFLNMPIPGFLKYMAFPIGYIIGSKLLDKKS